MERIIDEKTGEIVGANDAHERHKRIVGLRNQAEQTFLTLGEELYWFEEMKQWAELGYGTFNEYLADPEVDIQRRTAFRLKQVYAKFLLELKVSPVTLLPAGYSKLNELCSVVNEDNVDEWIDKASTLSRSDLKKEIAEAFPPPPPQPAPPGQYDLIYADPPWDYSNSGFDNAAASEYPTLTLEQLKDESIIPVRVLTCDFTVLFMWAVNPMLHNAIELMEAWGFEYKTNMAWVKDKGRGFGWWLRSKHETILIGVKPDTPQPKVRFDSAFEADRGSVHSRKPAKARDMIERMYPDAKRIELFARESFDGWDAWGNENV